MGGIPAWLLAKAGQDITVEPHVGSSARGQLYGPSVPVRALVENKRRMVRAKDGTMVTSEATVRMQLTEDCPVDSKVTLPDGRIATVLASNSIDGGSLPVPSHLEVALS